MWKGRVANREKQGVVVSNLEGNRRWPTVLQDVKWHIVEDRGRVAANRRRKEGRWQTVAERVMANHGGDGEVANREVKREGWPTVEERAVVPNRAGAEG